MFERTCITEILNLPLPDRRNSLKNGPINPFLCYKNTSSFLQGNFIMRHFLVLFLALVLCSTQAMADDSALARIRKNQEINCGVYVLGSIFSYDKSGKPGGLTVDLMNEIGDRTGLKVKYTEISSFATLFEDLKTGHFDMICSPLLLIPSTSMKGIPGAFIMEDPIHIYTEAGTDMSGVTSLDQLNNEKYIFVGLDGELGGLYAPRLFPKAKLNLLPLGTPFSNLFMEVLTKKANFMIMSELAFNAYAKDNPGKLKPVTDKSIYDSSVRFFYPEGSETLRANIDVMVDDMRRDGTLDKLLKQNGFKK